MRNNFCLIFIHLCLLALPCLSLVSNAAKKFDITQNKQKDLVKQLQQTQVKLDELSQDVVINQKKIINSIFNSKIEQVIKSDNVNDNINLQEMLQRFVKRNPDGGDLTAHALMMLAEQYFASEQSDILSGNFDNVNTGSKPNLGKSIKIYEQIIKTHPKYTFIDVAYYMLGICYSYEEKQNLAIKAWQQLVDFFPHSRFSDEVWFRLGEQKFNARSYRAAILDYQHINNKLSNFYVRALYKISWTNYILNQFQDAAEGFANLLDYYQSYADKNSGTASVLKSEAEEYLAISFADMHSDSLNGRLDVEAEEQGSLNFQMLNNFFQRVGPKVYERSVYIYFGDVLIKYAKLDGAKSAYLRAIELDVYNENNPKMLQRLEEAYAQAGRIGESVAVSKQIIQFYSLDTEWFKHQTSFGQKNALAKNTSILQTALLKVVLNQHAAIKHLLAAGTPNHEVAVELKAAVRYYLSYIKWFVTAGNIDEILFYLAEANFDLAHFSDSAFAFAQVRDWPWETKFREESALNVIFAYAKAIEVAQKNGDIPAFDLAQVKPENKAKFDKTVPTLLIKWQESIAKFATLYPNNHELVNFLFQSAGVDYAFNKLDKATSNLLNIITLFPNSKAAYLSAQLILEDRVSNGQWLEAGIEAAKFRDKKIGGKGDEFRNVEISARFKTAEALFESARKQLKMQDNEQAKIIFVKAAELYSQLFNEFPRAEIADKILFNSAIAFELGGEFVKAEANFKKVYQDFPKSLFAKEAMLKRAQYLEATLRFNDAAELYANFAKAFPDSSEAEQSLLNAALLYEADQKDDKAINLYKQFNLKFSNSAATQLVADQLVKLSNKLASSQAQSAVKNLQVDLSRFNNVRINAATGKRQGQQLIEKTNLLASLQKKYEIIAATYPESVGGLEALYNVGALYEGLYKALIMAPCPKDVAALGEEACDEYQSLLEDKAFVLESKAIKAFNLVQENAILVMQKNDWSLKAGAALHKLKPDEYPVAELYLEPNFSFDFCSQVNLADAMLSLSNAPDDLVARLNISADFYQQGKLQAAAMALDDSTAVNKNNACWYAWSGRVESSLNNNSASMEAYLKAASLPEVDKFDLAKLYWLMGNLFIKQKQFKSAEQNYAKSLQYNGGLGFVNYNLGLLYMNHDFAGLDKLMRLSKAKSYLADSLVDKEMSKGIKEKAQNFVKALAQQIAIIEKQNNPA